MLQEKNKYTENYLDCGWVSPDGYVIQCEYFQHTHEACEYAKKHQILIDGERFLESHGWLKITKTPSWNMNIILDSGVITKNQIKIVIEFMKRFNHYKLVKYNGENYTIDTIDKLLRSEE